jgi:hypothetical protein
MHTYWTFSSADGDVWDCGTCGHQWTVEVRETIKERQADGLGGSHQGSRLILLAGHSEARPRDQEQRERIISYARPDPYGDTGRLIGHG